MRIPLPSDPTSIRERLVGNICEDYSPPVGRHTWGKSISHGSKLARIRAGCVGDKYIAICENQLAVGKISHASNLSKGPQRRGSPAGSGTNHRRPVGGI